MIIAAIIQARCGSTRYPNKVFADLCGKPLIWHVVNRITFSNVINKVILATTTNPLDDKLYDWATKNRVTVVRGSENDVLNRYYQAARAAQADIIIRITADDPFKDPEIIDRAVIQLQQERADFVCNNYPPTYPEGLDVEVFTMNALEIAEKKSDSAFEREHVTQYFYKHPNDFKMCNIENNKDYSYLRWTLDTEADFLMAQEVYSYLYKDESSIFCTDDILKLITQHPKIAEMNRGVTRSEMYKSK